jgi:hypothetical protein
VKLSDILRFQVFRNKYVIQMSPIRTGSTLVFNLLREVLPRKRVLKKHQFSSGFGHCPIVATVRHPLDAIASVCRVGGIKISDEGLERATREFFENGAADVIRIRERPNVLVLRYELFIDDFEYIFAELEQFFNITISGVERVRLAQQYGVENAKRVAAKFDRFDEWDPETQIHGNHVSDNAKRIGYSSELFSGAQVDDLKRACSAYMEAFDYI